MEPREIRHRTKVLERPPNLRSARRDPIEKTGPDKRLRQLLATAELLVKGGKGRRALVVLSNPQTSIPHPLPENQPTSPGVEEHYEKCSKERTVLDLKEEKTLQEIVKSNDQLRKENTDLYLRDRKYQEQTRTSPSYEDFLLKGKTQLKLILDALSTKEKIIIAVKRTQTLAILIRKGIKNPDKLLQILEAESVNGSYLSYVRPENIEKDSYQKQYAIDSFNKIYENAQNNEFINKCGRIDNVSLAYKRMYQMGARLPLENIIRESPEQISTMARKLAKIPDEQFLTIFEELREYSFLFPETYDHMDDNLAFKPLVDFMSLNTQITPEQKQTLDIAQRIYKISAPGQNGYGKNDFHHLFSQHDPSVIISNRNRLSDELIVLEQLVSDLTDRRLRPDDPVRNSNRFNLAKYNDLISNRIEQLSQTGDLHTFAELIRNGFVIGSNQAFIFTDGYYSAGEGTLTTMQENIRVSAELLTQFSDKTFLSEVLLIEDILQSIHSGHETLAIGRAKFFEALARERSSSQKSLHTVVNLMDKLKCTPEKRSRLLGEIILPDNNLGISLNLRSILRELTSLNILDTMPQEDQSFWSQIFKWKEHKFQQLNDSENFVFSFLIQNQSRFSDFFQEGKLTNIFFNEFTKYFNVIPDEYYLAHKTDKEYVASSINEFLLDHDQAPPLIRGMAEAFRTLDHRELQQLCKILGTNYNKWTALITDDKLNVDFFSLILEDSDAVYVANLLLTTDVLDKFPDNQRNFWSVWKKVAGCSKDMSLFLFRNGEKNTTFYQNQCLTPIFLETYYKEAFITGMQADPYDTDRLNGLNGLIISKSLDGFPKADYSIWNAINQANNCTAGQFAIEHIEEIKSHYNEKGEPNSQLLVYLAKSGVIELQEAFLNEQTPIIFSEIEQAYWTEWKNLPNSAKAVFNQTLSTDSQIDESLVKKVVVFKSLLEEIEQSPSQELQKIKNELTVLLLESSMPEQALKEIRTLFERNNLPDFGKKFRIFEILYCTQGTDGKSRFDREMEKKGENLSPVLKRASRLRKLDIIYKDLLRINIDSADISLRNYLTAMQEGQVILDKIESQGVNNLTSAEVHIATRFLNRLNVLYENSLLRRQKKESASPLPESLDLQARILNLKKDLHVDGQKIIDRVFDMFMKPLGYESIDTVLSHMDEVKKQAHSRNLANPRVQEGQLEVASGDLLKAMEDNVLGYVLQNGSIAREYIGVNADSDSTPFDTDMGMILQEDIKGDLPHIISSSPVVNYGNTIVLVRNRGQFIRTDEQESVNLQYDSKNYELFPSGVIGEKHYGIRTGFPSTEIDAVILTQPLLDETQAATLKKEAIFFNIANNGFYIPVVDLEGKVIFTEANYSEYRLNQQSITETLTNPGFKPNEFIDSLKSSPYLKILYEMDSGVGEGYSTEQHTLMVMNQFEKYFSKDFVPAFLSEGDFRLMLALHDIGKPVAAFVTGSTSAQHEYTKKVLTYALQATGIKPNKVDTIMSLVDQDILGNYFKGEINCENSAHHINELAETIGVPPKDLVNTIKMFYMCDAGSYTINAGGPASLDSIFVFNNNGDSSSVTFSDENDAKYQELLRLLS